MEDFILGLLMINKLTAYELHMLIKNNYEGICSHSIGNIQRALKKLHEKELVFLEEVHEGKVVKKVFGITPAGRIHFMTWLNNPIDLLKAKNMELGRLLLLGFLTKEQQLATIDKTIADYKEACQYKQAIEDAVSAQLDELIRNSGVDQVFLDYRQDHPEYVAELMGSVEENDYVTLMHNVSKFGIITLKFGSAQIRFELEWFENLRHELASEAG